MEPLISTPDSHRNATFRCGNVEYAAVFRAQDIAHFHDNYEGPLKHQRLTFEEAVRIVRTGVLLAAGRNKRYLAIGKLGTRWYRVVVQLGYYSDNTANIITSYFENDHANIQTAEKALARARRMDG